MLCNVACLNFLVTSSLHFPLPSPVPSLPSLHSLSCLIHPILSFPVLSYPLLGVCALYLHCVALLKDTLQQVSSLAPTVPKGSKVHLIDSTNNNLNLNLNLNPNQIAVEKLQKVISCQTTSLWLLSFLFPFSLPFIDLNVRLSQFHQFRLPLLLNDIGGICLYPPAHITFLITIVYR